MGTHDRGIAESGTAWACPLPEACCFYFLSANHASSCWYLCWYRQQYKKKFAFDSIGYGTRRLSARGTKLRRFAATAWAKPPSAGVGRDSYSNFKQPADFAFRSEPGDPPWRHCEPPGRANARPMTGSAKQTSRAADGCWIASAYAQGRVGGLQARHSSQSERRRVVACALLRKRFAFVAGNDEQLRTHLCILAACSARVVPRTSSLEKQGRRESRARDAPAASRPKSKKDTSIVTTGSPETPAFPAQWF